MKLKDWLKEEKKTVADMARDLGLAHTIVLRWYKNVRIPSAENMLKITIYTQGKVTANDFYYGVNNDKKNI